MPVWTHSTMTRDASGMSYAGSLRCAVSNQRKKKMYGGYHNGFLLHDNNVLLTCDVL